MRQLFISTLISLVATASLADGFVCTTDAQDLRVSVYNKVNAEDGTRSPSKMIVSNPQISQGRKTIAKFSADAGTLATANATSDLLTYIGNVDLRFNDSSRKGEYLLGTRLGQVSTITLEVDFRYGDNLFDGEETDGLVTLVKRNGEVVRQYVTCTRYLKGL